MRENNMKILILEGIATSGKTTIKSRLEKYFNKFHNKNLNIVDLEKKFKIKIYEITYEEIPALLPSQEAPQ